MKNIEKLFEEKLDKLEKDTPPHLRYHNVHHTKHVLNSVEYIAKAEKITEKELELLKVAVLFHDLGFLIQRDGHEELSCEEAKRDLPAFDFSQEEIEKICGMIRATKTPQQPKNHLEKIIADAELPEIHKCWLRVSKEFTQCDADRWISLAEQFPQYGLNSLYQVIVKDGRDGAN